MSKALLHFEGLAVLLASLYFYAHEGGSWWLFFLCLFLPDLSILGYMFNKKAGAISYNAGHTYVLPLILLVLSMMWHHPLFLSLSLIWIAHIGMDRMVGYGLKYPDHFKKTHLQKVKNTY
ncbi:DUF4260 domain-containing protein [Halobacillus andaensis]|uniref:DUF4260 domain-containing protein n=1 Tax=Halobacillus andaensis TaxID=1176239 RepID=UPI003D709FFF